ncbi:zinc transporter foi-like [Lingula anatina]|uniref:Zinc transporter foi-like n=1 Tax=Lingula anatina TaxID=7574 RepID=A0A1S3J180_LINAN|nr:zinc transporter foi-like [Lingula anatina]|eukprot:XP_013404202.1 zinc transporter foi-like [Lingula anatina]
MLERVMTIVSERNAARKKNKKLKLDAQKEDEKADLSDEEIEEEETNIGPSEHVIRMVNSGGGDIVDLLDKLQHEEEAEKSGDVDDEERRRLKSSSSTDSEKGSRKNGNISQANGKNPSVEVIVQGHGHGHSHGAGAEGGMIGSMAWIVIMGDMIHNFCDGIAIGAAFSQSVTGGLSTSIAIVWHELPHELGDFAMCLRAGMSVRQAMFYNLIASVLAFIGMVIGVFAGQAPSATMWIFALAGGNFLYIALVDMLPELTHFKAATLKRELLVLLLQAVGMFSGVILLTGIAVYETDATF